MRTRASPKIHSESLLNIYLVDQMLRDPSIQFVERNLYSQWSYGGHLPSATGFNPFHSAIYFSKDSRISKWLARPHQATRDLNAGDQLVYEVFFAVHDYLHIWAHQAIRSLAPQYLFEISKPTQEDFEKLSFLHILTEAVATVGFDYWYLCKVDLNKILPIGTLRETFTTVFHQRYVSEFLKFNPKFDPSENSFFEKICNFYLSGEVPGFSISDVKKSPRLAHWLMTEMRYSEKQRIYTRSWLAYLFRNPTLVRSEKHLLAPIRVDEKWQQDLIKNLGDLLWQKVSLQKDQFFSHPLSSFSQESPLRPQLVDFRFSNVNSFTKDELKFLVQKGNYSHPDYLVSQILQRSQVSQHSNDRLQKVLANRKTLGKNEIMQLIKKMKPDDPSNNESFDIFLLS